MTSRSDETVAILEDLDKLVDQAMWAHAIGYQKPGRGLDAERGASLSRSEADEDKDDRYDIGVGDHKTRVAYQSALRAVSRSDVLMASALIEQGITYQPKVQPLHDWQPPWTLQLVARRLRWRLALVDPKHRRLRTVRTAIDRALRGLSKALGEGTRDYTAHKENLCRTCEIRERGNKKTECDVCHQYRFRHGSERPKRLDADSINQARAAQARRLARGEGHGVA